MPRSPTRLGRPEWFSNPLVAFVFTLVVTGGVGYVSVRLVGGPLPGTVYDLSYPMLGPTDAVVAATRATVLLTLVVPVTAAVWSTAWVTDRSVGWRPLAALWVGLFGLVAGTVAVSPFVPALVPVALLALVAVPFVLWWASDFDRTAMGASLGGTGAVAVLLFLGVILAGLAVGEGFLLVATAVDGANVSGAAADFESVPEVREDLFTSACAAGRNRSRASLGTCRFRFWNYDHEAALVDFLARNGARCPYDRRVGSSFVARHDGSYYRVTCRRTVD
ncbi:hypothetical protein ACOZ4N_14195 [Halorientalis pallida]|uniref:hypothetical protein n=1 Tax=Halorientalis pallida TaxID=2479928 RepID=UPI003C6EE634